MPHVAFVPLTGFRVREDALRELGMTLPGLADRGAAIARLPALGVLTLAGMMPPGWTCSHHDTHAVGDELVEALAAEKPDLVAVSALTASVEEAYRLAGLLRQRGLRSVLGGLHATACPDEAARHFDVVVAGEGEAVWPRLLADVMSDNLDRVYQPSAPFDLGRAPVPRFDLLGGRRPRFTLQTQRGCPLACEFCGASRLLGPFREKPVERLRDELAAITHLTPQPVVELADDNTFAGGRDPRPLFDVLAESGARYFTEVDWRIGERPEVLRGLAASGCVQVLVGLESLVFRHPGMGPKLAELRRMVAACEAIQAAGVAVIGCVIAGADGETRASLDRLTAFLCECPLADVQVTLQTPFPGTPLHRRLEKAGRLLADRGWSAYTLFDVTYEPVGMSVAELEAGFREVLTAAFSREQSKRRRRIRAETWRRHPRFMP